MLCVAVAALAVSSVSTTQAHGANAGATTSTIPPVQPPSLEELYASVESGVLRILASTCDAEGLGSGFLVSPNEVMTAAHVVSGAVSIAVEHGGQPVSATVLGADESLDVALIRLDRPVDGHIFTLSSELPPPGASVAAIGFPVFGQKSVTAGAVSGVERTVELPGGLVFSHMIQVDVPINQGSSGGPLLNQRGEVVGVVSTYSTEAQNLNHVAAASFALPLIDAWRRQPQPQVAGCDTPLGPEVAAADLQGPPTAGDMLTAVVMDTFWLYFESINLGYYELARDRVAPGRRLPSDQFADALSTTYDFNVVVQSVMPAPHGADAWVTFTSLQAPHLGTRPGESCTHWSIDYRLVPADDGLMWLDGAVGHAGGPISQPC
jgi:serine protease Do